MPQLHDMQPLLVGVQPRQNFRHAAATEKSMQAQYALQNAGQEQSSTTVDAANALSRSHTGGQSSVMQSDKVSLHTCVSDALSSSRSPASDVTSTASTVGGCGSDSRASARGSRSR